MTKDQTHTDKYHWDLAPTVSVQPGASAGDWATKQHNSAITVNNSLISCINGNIPENGKCIVPNFKTGGRKKKSLKKKKLKINSLKKKKLKKKK